MHYFGSPICGHFFGGPNCFAPDSPLRAVRSHHRTMAPGVQRRRPTDASSAKHTAPAVGTNPIDASAIVTVMAMAPACAASVRRADKEKAKETEKEKEKEKAKESEKENDDDNEPAEEAPWLGARPKASPQVRGSRERETRRLISQ